MAVRVKLRCSECETILEKDLVADEKEIVCVVCGRRMANFSADDFQQMETAQKSQRTMAIISLVLFAIAVICVLLWVGVGDTGAWVSGVSNEANMGAMIGAVVCALASLVVGIIASMKRIVVEF
jgi:hypothetical protein